MPKRPAASTPPSVPTSKKSKPSSSGAPTPDDLPKVLPSTASSNKRKTAEDFLDDEPASSKKGKKDPVSSKVVEKVKEVVVKPAMKKVKEVVLENASTLKPALNKTAPLKSALKSSSSTAVTTAKKPASKPKAKPASTYIAGFSSSSESDSDDDDDTAAIAQSKKQIKGIERDLPVDVASLPTIAKDDEVVAKRLKKARAKNDKEKGTLYLGRIPHGFYEDEMRQYFSQFGDVTRLRLARNRKTGASKHFAYIEMSSKSVAEITAETMDNYLLMGHILKCSVVPQDQIHPDLWIGANRKFRPVPTARIERTKFEKVRTPEEKAKADKGLLKKQAKRQERLKALGIDYELPGHTQS